MTIWQAIILGLVQGLTEFLPISSSAHLTIAGTMMGLVSPEHPERWTAFVAVIQLGTLAAVLFYFARDIAQIGGSFLRENLVERRGWARQSQNARMGWYVISGSVPIATIGLALKDVIEGALTKDISVIAGSLLVLALIMALAEKVARHHRGMESLTMRDALAVGLAQVLALIPGSSRSGTTLTAGLFLGLNRDVAARFSFLLSIPAVFGAGMLEFKHAVGDVTGDDLLALVVATVVSGISGYAAIAWLLRYLRNHSTFLFVGYRIALAAYLFWWIS
jgi:undecaprenyl-diphosphatase